jgi:type I restriction enzyme S subunit
MVELMKHTEYGNIPEDWQVKTLGDVGDVKMCRRVFHHETKSQGPIPFYKIGTFAKEPDAFISLELYNRYRQRFSFPSKGDILISAAGTIGRTWIYDGKAAYFQDSNIVWIENRDMLLSNDFLNHILQVVKYSTEGGTIQRLYNSILRNTKFICPISKIEQNAITTALDDINTLILQLEQLLSKKRNIKTGVMHEMLKPKDGWEEKTLGEVATLKARIGWQGLTTAEYRKSGNYFLITGTEFKNGFIDWESCFYVDAERYKQDRNIQVKEHDVLVTKDGTIGKIALIKSVPKPATLNSGVFVIRPIANSFHPEFFYYLLLSEVFLIFLSQLSAGSTINLLYQKDFVTFKFHQPSTLEEQKKIALILSDMDEEIQELEKQLEKYKALKQGMMQSLLTGKIRLI